MLSLSVVTQPTAQRPALPWGLEFPLTASRNNSCTFSSLFQRPLVGMGSVRAVIPAGFRTVLMLLTAPCAPGSSRKQCCMQSAN